MSFRCPGCQKLTTPHAQCKQCGVQMCHHCFVSKKAQSKCPFCGKMHTVKPK